MKILLHITLGLISCQSKTDTTGFRNGDIIFQTSTSGQSKAIQIATGSKYSHMGIIYKQVNDFFVYETVQPVKLRLLKPSGVKGRGAKYELKKLASKKRNSKLPKTFTETYNAKSSVIDKNSFREFVLID